MANFKVADGATIKHNGKTYTEGASIPAKELDAKQTEQLIEGGALVEVKATKKAATKAD